MLVMICLPPAALAVSFSPSACFHNRWLALIIFSIFSGILPAGRKQSPPNLPMAMTRLDITELIITNRLKKRLTWSKIAEVVGRSREWTTAGCLGQMTFTPAQAEALAKLLDLPDEAKALLQKPPYRGSLPTAVPTDPLIYRFYELISVYGTTFKELIHEEFGDGIMSAIDFNMKLEREPNPAGDRVRITMSGKFLSYKEY
jgi:cyanate lyase